MNVTYIPSVGFEKGSTTVSQRVLTEILVQDSRFTKTVIYPLSLKFYKDHVRRNSNEKLDYLLRTTQVSFVLNVIADILSGIYDQKLNEIETEYVIITCMSCIDLYFVKELLRRKKKVIIGGPYINLLKGTIRKIFAAMNINTDNLLIIYGLADLSTPLYEIILEWKDCEIKKNKLETIFDCVNNYTPEITGGMLYTVFNSDCFHAKCRYCALKILPRRDFIENVTAERIVKQLHKIQSNYSTNYIYLGDPYPKFTNKIIQILTTLKNKNNKVTLQTGIKLLTKQSNIELLNVIASRISIGLESTSDYSLYCCQKGVTYKDIQIAMKNIINGLERNIHIQLNIMIDLPVKDIQDAKNNYDRIITLIKKLRESGFDVSVLYYPISLTSYQNMIGTYYGIKEVSNKKNLVGVSYLINHIENFAPNNFSIGRMNRIIDENSVGYMDIDTPLVRYGMNGKVIPSDFEIVGHEVISRLS